MAIRSFRHKGLETLFETGSMRKVDPSQASRLAELLDQLEFARQLEDVRSRTNGLHKLRGDRVGQWAVTVSRNWRLVFEFRGSDAFNVDLVDYH